jgi:hypothetical protein
MRIINKTSNPRFFPYAGRSRRGVNLDPDCCSPDLGMEKLAHPQLKRDLKHGRIQLVLEDAERAALQGSADESVLESSVAASEVPAEKKPTPKAKAPKPPAVEDNDGPAIVVESEEPASPGSVNTGIAINAIYEELHETLSLLTPEGQQEKLAELDSTAGPAVRDLLPSLREAFPAPKPDVVEEPDEGPDEEPAEDPALKYKNWTRKRMVAELADRELDISPTADLNDMRAALGAHDAASA